MKKFNITGTCFPQQHYMADITKKLDYALGMVEHGEYFAINKPRQYGKTTLLYNLSDRLQANGYAVLNISFEGIGDSIFEDEGVFSSGFVSVLAEYAEFYMPDVAEWLKQQSTAVHSLKELKSMISAFVKKADRRIVLLIDEVDKSSNNQLFVSFLAMLRNKYLERNQFPTFQSVILAGLHDVKSLKIKLRPKEEAKYNSPWNIASDFKVAMELQTDEIVPMLQDYAQEQQVSMDFWAVADALFYYTSGYPFLVSALCKIVAEDILPTKQERTWTAFDIEVAADRLIKSERSNTNFDSLVKNLENNSDLYDLVYRMVIENEPIIYNSLAPLVNFGLLHGLFRNGQGLNIHNRIYREVISNYMTVKAMTERKSLHIGAT
jgi:hypothetical protein